MNIIIRGRGVAASCAGHLLGLHGIAPATEASDGAALPVVMLSDPAIALIRDVFDRPDLFADRPRIDRRIVRWGQSTSVTMNHSATIVTGTELESALAVHMPAGSGPPDFTIHATSPLPAPGLKHFGTRPAFAAEANLREAGDSTACWIESLEAGWLFLIPSGRGQAWLLCIGMALDEAMARSCLIAPRVALDVAMPQVFDPAPRMAVETAGMNWIGCGTAAIAFDPICGDGTAQAVREAILASAVIAAIRDGGDAAQLVAHYRAMLTAAMRKHLQLCAPFYRTGGTGQWWQEAHDALAEGHDWCTAQLAAIPSPRYMLKGYALVDLERAA